MIETHDWDWGVSATPGGRQWPKCRACGYVRGTGDDDAPCHSVGISGAGQEPRRYTAEDVADAVLMLYCLLPDEERPRMKPAIIARTQRDLTPDGVERAFRLLEDTVAVNEAIGRAPVLELGRALEGHDDDA